MEDSKSNELKLGKFEISRLVLEIKLLEKHDIVIDGKQAILFTIPNEIINLLSDLQLPTIHKVLEVILFYSSYYGRTEEIEEVMNSLLEEYTDQEELLKAIRLVRKHDLVNKIEEALFNVYNMVGSILFCGWTITKGSPNFYENYDIIIRSDDSKVGFGIFSGAKIGIKK